MKADDAACVQFEHRRPGRSSKRCRVVNEPVDAAVDMADSAGPEALLAEGIAEYVGHRVDAVARIECRVTDRADGRMHVPRLRFKQEWFGRRGIACDLQEGEVGRMVIRNKQDFFHIYR